MGLSWMAWTGPTAGFFVFIGICFAVMSVWEFVSPGGGPRHGILGLDTTRGDRLFVSLLGSAFIFLAWLGFLGPFVLGFLGLAGPMLLIPVMIAIVYAICVFLWA
ncbi:DUF2160 domain-containing protein [Stappia sp. ES.058]|uniref:DUF2160 domain-containing protein n=1 Tax=Stappia sp. ES.058 TaxID=1881061 RepID=UPI00087DA27D|nr:DUF2160 family membrane protein [Stappia sp. ES.058]SDU44868.1 Predicted small integral membrane protein [Stappia sp. ES.058]